jgi:hypothetical protein
VSRDELALGRFTRADPKPKQPGSSPRKHALTGAAWGGPTPRPGQSSEGDPRATLPIGLVAPLRSLCACCPCCTGSRPGGPILFVALLLFWRCSSFYLSPPSKLVSVRIILITDVSFDRRPLFFALQQYQPTLAFTPSRSSPFAPFALLHSLQTRSAIVTSQTQLHSFSLLFR